MTELENRRQELLIQARKTYSDKTYLPAIHPRYGAIYQNLYDNREGGQSRDSKETGSTLGYRVLVALICFVMYAFVDYKGMEILNYDSQQLVEAVSYNIKVENVWDSW